MVLAPATNAALPLSNVKSVQTGNCALFSRLAGVPLTTMFKPALSVDQRP